MDPETFMTVVMQERDQARQSFPPFHSYHEGYAVILEELDEVWEAIKHHEPQLRILQELVQVTAMCVCFADELLELPSASQLRTTGR